MVEQVAEEMAEAVAGDLHAHFRQVLAQRMAGQREAVRQRLRQRMDALPQRPATPRAPQRAAGPSALALLNAELAQRAGTASATGPERLQTSAPLPELASVRRFGQTWAKVATEQQMIEALAKAPKNAGPLNSHRLMLRALTQMRRLSPDYLRLFLAQMEALLWVEEAVARLPKPAVKAKGSAGRVVKRKG
jgi:hypothetical protein